MTLRRAETLALIAGAALLSAVTAADSVRLAPLAERQREDVRLVSALARREGYRPAWSTVHVGARHDSACTTLGLDTRRRLCVHVLRPPGAAARIVLTRSG